MVTAMSAILILSTLSFFLCTGTSSEDALTFLAVGDMGGVPVFPYTTPIQMATAVRMAHVADKIKPEFIMALGDNFYTHGVKDVNDMRFKETFENVYVQASLQTPWYILAGNHDHYGNVSAEIAYTKISKRWNFPELYYSRSFEIPGTSNTVDIVMIDTVTLCGNTNYLDRNSVPKGPADVNAAEDQWDWIEESLEKSKATYLLVAGHFPVYSVAEHGPTSCLVERLLPMLYKYKVSAYLCGHDHNLQHLQTQSSDNITVDFILTGAANIVDTSLAHDKDVPEGSLKFHWAHPLELGGLTLLEANPQHLNFTFIDAVGSNIYHSTILPRNM